MKLKYLILIITLLIVFFFALSFFVEMLIHNSDAYKATIEYLKTDSQIIEQYGKYEKTSFLVFGSIQTETHNGQKRGTAKLSTKVHTDMGIYKVNFELEYIDGKWEVINKTFESSNNFKLKDYNYYVENFSSEKVLGEIDSEEQARKTAEKVFVEIYGKSVVDKKPYRVSFDDESQVWLVQGNISKHNIGGIPNILIQKSDGKVLAIWHSK